MSKTSRRTFLQIAPAGATLSAIGHAADGAAEPSPTTIWYRQPAGKWEEALAIGNGRLGAMIFGGVEKERLQLNEITLWSGRLEPDADRPEAYKGLPGIRGLIKEGKYPEFPNARLCKAMLDRLTDQAHIIDTGKESYRFLRTMKKQGKGAKA